MTRFCWTSLKTHLNCHSSASVLGFLVAVFSVRILSELEETENFYYNITDLFCCREWCWSWLWRILSSLWHGLSHLRMEACVLHFMFTKCFCTKLLQLLSLSLTEIPEVVYSTGNFRKCSQFCKGLMGLEICWYGLDANSTYPPRTHRWC
jgi:hypothetical protein